MKITERCGLRKIAALASAITVIASSMSVTAFAATTNVSSTQVITETYMNEPIIENVNSNGKISNMASEGGECSLDFEVRDDGAYFTGISNANGVEVVVIPEKTEEDVPVVGIENLAFYTCTSLKKVIVPDSVKIGNIGDIAFLTRTDIEDICLKNGQDQKLSTGLAYAANIVKYKGKSDWKEDDKDLEGAEKILRGIKKTLGYEDNSDISLKEAAAIVRAIYLYDEWGLKSTIVRGEDEVSGEKMSEKSYNYFIAWVKAIPEDVTIVASKGSDAEKYAKGKRLIGVKYEEAVPQEIISETHLRGDANGDGIVNVRDCAKIANALAFKTVDELSCMECADYNRDGEVTVRDAAQLANYLASGKKPEKEEVKTIEETLKDLDSVTDVKVIAPAEADTNYSGRYLVTFEQPIDWNDPSVGSFPQRVVVDLSDNAEINVLETQGYSLMDHFYPESIRESTDLLSLYTLPEMTSLVTESGNYINVEHRFFGDSAPSDIDRTDTKYWEYLTPENAANDYHHIYTALEPVLGQRWVSVGTSRGGLMTNVYAKYFPDDMNVYIPYVAPCSDGLESDSMYKFVYEEIGNDVFGKETAEKYRGIVTDFQVELMKNKKAILPDFKNVIEKQEMLFENGLDKIDQLYDLDVLEFGIQVWQYKEKQDFDSLKAILDMPEDTDAMKAQKIKELEIKLLTTQSPEDWSYNCFGWPYYVNAAMYYGQYHYDFSYLREAMENAGVENTLSVTPEMEKDIPWSIVFTPEQREAFAYDASFYSEMIADMKTTDAKHLMIFGATDPWLSQAIPEEASNGNDNIRRYVNPDYPHNSSISNMPEEYKNEIIDLLKEWLSIK